MHGLVKGSIVVPEKFSTSYLKKVLDKDLFEDFLYFFDQQDKDENRIFGNCNSSDWTMQN